MGHIDDPQRARDATSEEMIVSEQAAVTGDMLDMLRQQVAGANQQIAAYTHARDCLGEAINIAETRRSAAVAALDMYELNQSDVPADVGGAVPGDAIPTLKRSL